MMGHREPLRGGDEYDFLTKAIKRQFSKRVRRDAKSELRSTDDE